jgi:hypothetical protein
MGRKKAFIPTTPRWNEGALADLPASSDHVPDIVWHTVLLSSLAGLALKDCCTKYSIPEPFSDKR